MPQDIARAGERQAGEDRWSLVGVAGICSFLAMLDMSVVTVAVPGIGADLGVPVSVAQWAVLGYQLPVVALLLPAGRRLDRAPIRPVVLLALAGFGVCGVVAALAPFAAWLIAARVGQGAFAAVLFVLMPVLAAKSVRPQMRGRAMSVPATLGPLGAVTGPALGGILLDHWGWRSVLLIKLPLCLLAWALTRATPLPPGWPNHPAPGREPAGPGREMGAEGGQPPAAVGRLRVSGGGQWWDAVLVGSATAAVLLALSLVGEGRGWLLLCAVAVPPAVVWVRGAGGRRVLEVLRGARTGGIHGAVLALGVGFATVHYLLSLHLQRADGLSASATGVALLAFPAGMALAGPVGGRLADRWGAGAIAAGGAVLVTVGFALLAVAPEWTPGGVAWRLALAGAGMGLYGGPAQLLVFAAVGPERMATAGSSVQLARSLGFTLGPAIGTTLWTLSGPGPEAIRTGLVLSAAVAFSAVGLLAVAWKAQVRRGTSDGRDGAGGAVG